MRSIRWVVALNFALVVLSCILAGLAFTRSRSNASEPAFATMASTPPVYVHPEMRQLIEPVIARGEVKALGETKVLPLGVEAGVVTGINVEIGASLADGDRLGSISELPVVVIEGVIPMFRDIKSEMTGADVEQLQKSLRRQGFAINEQETRDRRFGDSTQTAARKMFKQRDYLLPEEPAVTVGEAESTASSSDSTSTTSQPTHIQTAPFIPKGVLVSMSLPAQVTYVAPLGSTITSEAGFVRATSQGTSVVSSLRAVVAQSITVGGDVALLDDVDPNAQKISGIVSAVSDAGTEAERMITIQPESAFPIDAVGKNVRVTFQVGGSTQPVLSVPLSAVRNIGGQASVTTRQGASIQVVIGTTAQGWAELRHVEGLSTSDEVLVG